ncbi:MAG: zinc ribbon domain-containing protein [Deltaproteobacteria bacterium]|jgi:putative FmdB family regulatory protein|nr:zinc ribbon domain-containing protein [Deltaproteobacteria bacterium]
MPIYEYLCRKCKRKSEIITFSVSEDVSAVCRHCGSAEVYRVPSRVRVRMSEETRMERLADPARLSGLDENDPKSMARWMKSMSREMGDELGDDFDVDEMMDEAMAEKDGMEGGGGGDSGAGGYDE